MINDASDRHLELTNAHLTSTLPDSKVGFPSPKSSHPQICTAVFLVQADLGTSMN